MNSDIEAKTNRTPATKVGGMRVSAPDHPVPVVRKEHDRKTEPEEGNEDEQQLEKADKFEHDRLGKMAAAERLAKMEEYQPKHDFHGNFRQKENIVIDQPIRHTHNKSGAAAIGQQH
ncbi:hypothetical protein BGX34_007847 [Mortierella sp. NVP85]|nr:hypothetical protein BGX34_007847 [Mortierella sp. NVP85]